MQRCLLVICLCLLLFGPAMVLDAQTVLPGRSAVGPERPEPVLPQPGGVIPDWQARLELARLQSYVGDFRGSLDSYARVLADQPDNLQVRLERAKVLTWADRHEEAWVELASIPEDRLDTESRLILADLHAARQDYDKSLTILAEHLQNAPDDHSSRLRMAEVLSWAGRYEQSLEQYATLLKVLPDDVQLRRKLAFVLSWAGKHDQAIRELQATLP